MRWYAALLSVLTVLATCLICHRSNAYVWGQLEHETCWRIESWKGAEHECLQATLSPIVDNEMTVILEASGDNLESARFLVADDLNDDGVIQKNEWKQVARGTIALDQFSVPVVRFAPVLISALHDAYQIEQIWKDFGPSYSTDVRPGIVVE